MADSDKQVVVTGNSVVITLTDDQKKQAEECLRRSGQVKITLKEITVTALPEVTSANVIVD